MDGPAATRRSLIEIHLAVFLFGFPGLFGKWLALPPSTIVLGRVVFAAAALALVHAAGRRSLRIRPRADLVLLAACGALLAVHWTAFFKSVQVSTVAVGLLSYSTFPVFTAVMEPLAFRERFSRMSLLWAFLCVAGVALVVPEYRASNAVFAGVLWGLLAGVTFAILTLLNRGLARRHSGLTIAFYQDLAAAVVLLPVFAAAPSRLDGRSLPLLAALGVVGTAAAHSLFIQGMKRVRARTASVISALEPVYGTLLALALLGEVPPLRTILGGLLIVGAAAAASLAAARESSPTPAPAKLSPN